MSFNYKTKTERTGYSIRTPKEISKLPVARVFISVGMRGRKDSDIQRDINTIKIQALKDLADKQVIFVDNFNCLPPREDQRLYYLAEAIKKLGDCDYCYFADGYEDYPGCQVEMAVCTCYKIPYVEMGVLS